MNFTQRLLMGVASVGLATAGLLGVAQTAPTAEAVSGTTQTDAVASALGAVQSVQQRAEAAQAESERNRTSLVGWRSVSAGELLSTRTADLTASVRDRA